MTARGQYTRHLSDAGRANERMHDNGLSSDGFQARDVRTEFVMVHELPMLEVPANALGVALMQPNSRHGMDRKDKV